MTMTFLHDFLSTTDSIPECERTAHTTYATAGHDGGEISHMPRFAAGITELDDLFPTDWTAVERPDRRVQKQRKARRFRLLRGFHKRQAVSQVTPTDPRSRRLPERLLRRLRSCADPPANRPFCPAPEWASFKLRRSRAAKSSQKSSELTANRQSAGPVRAKGNSLAAEELLFRQGLALVRLRLWADAEFPLAAEASDRGDHSVLPATDSSLTVVRYSCGKTPGADDRNPL